MGNTKFQTGDYAIARSNSINKDSKKPELYVVEIIEYDKTFSAYKVKEPTGRKAWYNTDRLQYTDNDPIVTKSYCEILNLRHQVLNLTETIDDYKQELDNYKNRSILRRFIEFFTGSK